MNNSDREAQAEDLDSKAWTMMLVATQDQLDELEAAHAAFKTLQASYHREQGEVFNEIRATLREGE